MYLVFFDNKYMYWT